LFRLLTLAALAMLVLVPMASWADTTRGPDAGGYTATNGAVYSFVDISAGGSAISVLSGTDDGTVPLAIPFAFSFYGKSYNMVCVSSNGALYFITGASACGGAPNDFANTDLTVAPPPNDPPALLPFWTDLSFAVPGAGSVFYQTLGTAGNRRFIVQWNNAYPQGSQNPVTFEAILFEAGSRILFQYQNVDLGGGDPNNDAGRATIGIHNSGGLNNGQQIAWSYDAAVVRNNTALQFSSQQTPTINWPAPSPLIYGSPLGSAQLDATASFNGTAVPGTFTYRPPMGTVLPVGSYTLSASFVPANSASFTGATATAQINVEYNVCALYDQTKSVNSGAVIPIKVQLCDVNGNDASGVSIVLHATGLTSVSGYSGPTVTVGNANPDNDFRFDSSLGSTGGYIFNLSTKGLTPGTYSLQFAASGDPIPHSVNFGVR
jgi:hypothetical protein